MFSSNLVPRYNFPDIWIIINKLCFNFDLINLLKLFLVLILISIKVFMTEI